MLAEILFWIVSLVLGILLYFVMTQDQAAGFYAPLLRCFYKSRRVKLTRLSSKRTMV